MIHGIELGSYGGEEFVAVLPGTDIECAMAAAQTMRDCIIDLRIPHEGTSIGDCISISLGVCSSNRQSIETSQALLKQADEHFIKQRIIDVINSRISGDYFSMSGLLDTQ